MKKSSTIGLKSKEQLFSYKMAIDFNSADEHSAERQVDDASSNQVVRFRTRSILRRFNQRDGYDSLLLNIEEWRNWFFVLIASKHDEYQGLMRICCRNLRADRRVGSGQQQRISCARACHRAGSDFQYRIYSFSFSWGWWDKVMEWSWRFCPGTGPVRPWSRIVLHHDWIHSQSYCKYPPLKWSCKNTMNVDLLSWHQAMALQEQTSFG